MCSFYAPLHNAGLETSLTSVDTLLYVSRAVIPACADRDEIGALLEVARPRNRALGVTGAIIFTRDNFAQLLEGPRHAIDELMNDIQRDPRHTDLRIVRRESGVARRFGGWDMAYDGPSIFVARHVRVLGASFSTPSEVHITRLMNLMESLSSHRSG